MMSSLRSKRFREFVEKAGKRAKTGITGEGEGREGNACRSKPHKKKKLHSPTNAASHWCGAGSVD